MIVFFPIWLTSKILSCKDPFFSMFRIDPFSLRRNNEPRSETFANYVKHFADMKCSLLPSSFTSVKPLSVHVRGFEPEQIYQQLKSINDARLKPFIAAIAKHKTRPKTFGNLLRPPSPEPTAVEEDNEQQEDEEPSPVPVKKSPKKKKSVT